MGGYLIIGQACGSVMVSQCRYALSRQSSSHCGSFFLWLMKRTISSLRPIGASSASTSVTKPHLYSRLASVSISVSAVGMVHSVNMENGKCEMENVVCITFTFFHLPF